MKSSFMSMVVLLVTVSSFAGMTFNDVDFWVGEGANQAVLVVDWNDGPSELVKVWGFRWDGTATGADMLLAVCEADSLLYTMGTDVPGKGIAFGGIGYDRDVDSIFDIAKIGSTSNFDTNGYMAVTSDTEFDGWSIVDADDNWAGGWWTDGFWGYSYIEAGSATWTGSLVGASGRTLTDGCWDGWSWGAAPGWYGGDPSVTVTVPEPISLVLFGAGLFLARKRK